MSKQKKIQETEKTENLNEIPQENYLEEPREWNNILELKEELIALAIKQSKSFVEMDSNLPDGYRYLLLGTFTRLLLSEIIIDGHIELLAGDGIEWFENTVNKVAYATSFREGIQLTPSVKLQGRIINLLREYARAQREYAVFTTRGANELIRPLRIQRISVQSFAPYGKGREFNESDIEKFYKQQASSTFYLDGQRYSGMSLWEGSKAPVELGRFVASQRQFDLCECSIHKDTDELIVPDRPCIIQIESEDEKSDFFNGDLFLIPEGLPIYIKKNHPHSIPFGISLGAFTSPVLFQVNTDSRQRDVNKRVYNFKRKFLVWPKF